MVPVEPALSWHQNSLTQKAAAPSLVFLVPTFVLLPSTFSVGCIPTAARHLRPLPHCGSCCPLLHASRWLLSSKRLSWLSFQCCCCGAILLLHDWHQWPLSLGMSSLTSVMLLCSSPAFLDKMSIHVAKNFLDLPKIKIPLILGIWGKRFMSQGSVLELHIPCLRSGFCTEVEQHSSTFCLYAPARTFRG